MARTVSTYTRKLVRKRVEAQMLASITIQRGDLGALNPTTGTVGGLTNLVTIYSGKARIWTAGGNAIALGDGIIDMNQTYVSIPIDATTTPRRDDIVTVLNDMLADVDLDDRVLRVMEVDGGGLVGAARRLTCSYFNQSRYWTQ